MAATEPFLSLITVNYNTKQVTLELLEALKNSRFRNFEIIVVDNASADNPREDIERIYPGATVIVSDTNLGFAGANNLGLQKAKGDYLFFINNDTEPDPDCLGTLVKTAGELEHLGALSPKFHYYHTPKLIEYAGTTNINKFTARNSNIGFHETDNLNAYTGVIETFYAHGGGMLVPRKVIADVGPMSEDFFLYYEEMDWCERIRRGGYKIYCQRDALLHHKESASVGRANPLKTYYLNRNRVLFMRKNYQGFDFLPFMLFFTFISIPKNILTFSLRRQWQHLRAFVRGVLWNIDTSYTFK